jgi:serine/threonine protein kinase
MVLSLHDLLVVAGIVFVHGHEKFQILAEAIWPNGYLAQRLFGQKPGFSRSYLAKSQAEILKELNSDHVVKYINSYQDNDKKLILVMEYCQYGDMSY